MDMEFTQSNECERRQRLDRSGGPRSRDKVVLATANPFTNGGTEIFGGEPLLTKSVRDPPRQAHARYDGSVRRFEPEFSHLGSFPSSPTK